MGAADRLHSVAIHILRRARLEDRATGLTPERLSLLSVLVFVGPKTASELAEIEQVSRPAITRTLNALEEQSLVHRQRSTEDRRRQIVRATEEGRLLLEQGRLRRVGRLAAELEKLSDSEVASLEEALSVLEKLDV